jgi:CO/xanthine dehydrogenase Mo-binding subunit
VKIIDAVKLASSWLRFPEKMSDSDFISGIGHSSVDYDGVAKVCGNLVFADDMYPEGVLHGKILWSPYAHAEIISIDTTAAKKVLGVKAVFTAKDIPGHNGLGAFKADRPVLCEDRVRFLGDMVSVVFAESIEAANEAVACITVNYKELPGVFSPQEGISPESPRLHPQGNICAHLVHEKGDLEEGFQQSGVIVQGHFETPFQEHAYLEPEASIGLIDERGVLTIYAPTQFPFQNRKQVADMLKIAEEKVRVIATPLGGGFGGKLDIATEAVAALGAYYLKRPVKVTLTREESLKLSTKRHSYYLDYRVGFDNAGNILALDAKLLSDAGPYTSLSPRIIDQACLFAAGPYKVPNLRVEGWAVFSNNANGGAFRGFGINQAAVAMESLLDEAARKLKMDPFELRLINALEVGDETLSGEILKVSVAMKATIEAARTKLQEYMPEIREQQNTGKSIGIGVAGAFKNVGAGKGKVDDAGAIFILQPNGRILVRASAVDMGQGIRTALVQIAAEALGVDENLFDIITGDTAQIIIFGGATGEKQTLITGKAVEIAAGKFKEALLQKASVLGKNPAANLSITKNVITNQNNKKVFTIAELADLLNAAGEKVEIYYNHIMPKTYPLADNEAKKKIPQDEYRNYPAYTYTTQVAVVEVDKQSGSVKVLKIIAAHDCGRVINLQKIEGQIEGSCVQGMGYALSEGYLLDKGIPLVRNFKQLNLPTIIDAPDIDCILIEDPEPAGPFGAKGVSEVATVPITPAILNAIYDAAGVRIKSLPATPDKLRSAFEKVSQ